MPYPLLPLVFSLPHRLSEHKINPETAVGCPQNSLPHANCTAAGQAVGLPQPGGLPAKSLLERKIRLVHGQLILAGYELRLACVPQHLLLVVVDGGLQAGEGARR
jgi:hypothetical protein